MTGNSINLFCNRSNSIMGWFNNYISYINKKRKRNELVKSQINDITHLASKRETHSLSLFCCVLTKFSLKDNVRHIL